MIKFLGTCFFNRKNLHPITLLIFLIPLFFLNQACKEGKNNVSGELSGLSPQILANQEKAISFLEDLIIAEKEYAVKYGSYADINGVKEKGLFNFQESDLENAGYKIRIEYSGTKKINIYLNPIEYKKSGFFSFYTDETSILRSEDHNGLDASVLDPEVSVEMFKN
jgi:hypothetical protein